MAIPIPDVSHAALLSMDMHASIVSIYAQGHDGFIDRAAGVLDAARERGMLVIHVRLEFHPGLPEISDRNVLFSQVKSSQQWQQLFMGATGALHPTVAPREGEVVVGKHRGSAFTGTDLEMILRANEIDMLKLMGIATSGVVLATLLHAADADYRLVVVKDCCLDRDADVHAVPVERFFPRMSAVVDKDAMLQALRAR